jgi:hypothetical protein
VNRGALGRRLAPIACGCVAAAAGVYVALNDPAAEGSRFPGCALRGLTGLWCPGCGLTRGVHSLFRGDVAGAVSSNVFTPIVVVLIVAGWWTWVRRSFGAERRFALRHVPAWVWVVLAGVVLTYGVLRNISAEPFASLAP